jgi:hypothetical protein
MAPWVAAVRCAALLAWTENSVAFRFTGPPTSCGTTRSPASESEASRILDALESVSSVAGDGPSEQQD